MKSLGRAASGVLLVASGGCLVALSSGCRTDDMVNEPVRAPEGPTTSMEHPEGVDVPTIELTDRTEVDLVEEMTLHRAQYARLLEALARYYTENGYPQKAEWAAAELNALRRVKAYRYLRDAEVPRAELRPTESIAEADRLYSEGKALMKKAGHGLAVFYNQSKMREALARFKTLVENYPTSDKIDDAAYYIGEIYKEYEAEKDNELAVWWYQRAIDWDPNTPHPCRFRIATTYDYRSHEREKALYWYQQTLEHESKFTSHDDPDFTANADYAARRIRELTPEEHLRSPADRVADGRPTPVRSAPPTASDPPPPEQ